MSLLDNFAPPIKKCTVCKLQLPSAEFSNDRTRRDGRRSVCRGCASARSQQQRDERDIEIIQYLEGHPCVDCGEHDLLVLQFDHLEPRRFGVTSKMNSKKNLRLNLLSAKFGVLTAMPERPMRGQINSVSATSRRRRFDVSSR